MYRKSTPRTRRAAASGIVVASVIVFGMSISVAQNPEPGINGVWSGAAHAAPPGTVIVKDDINARLNDALNACNVGTIQVPKRWVRNGREDPNVLLKKYLSELVNLNFLKLYESATPLPKGVQLDDLGRQILVGSDSGGPPDVKSFYAQIDPAAPGALFLPSQLGSGGDPSLGFPIASRDNYKLRMECGSLFAGFLDAQAAAGATLPIAEVQSSAKIALQNSFKSHRAVSVAGGTSVSILSDVFHEIIQSGSAPDAHKFAPLTRVWVLYSDPAFAAKAHYILAGLNGMVVRTEDVRDFSTTAANELQASAKMSYGVFTGGMSSGATWQTSKTGLSSSTTDELYYFTSPTFTAVPTPNQILQVWPKYGVPEARYPEGDTAARISRSAPGRASLSFGPITPDLCNSVELSAQPAGFSHADLIGPMSRGANPVMNGDFCVVELLLPLQTAIPARYAGMRQVAGSLDATFELKTPTRALVADAAQKLQRTYTLAYEVALDPVPQVSTVVTTGGKGRPYSWEIAFGSSSTGVVSVDLRQGELTAAPSECNTRLGEIVEADMSTWIAPTWTVGGGANGLLVVPAKGSKSTEFPAEFPARCTIFVPVNMKTGNTTASRSNAAVLAARLEIPRALSDTSEFLEVPMKDGLELRDLVDADIPTALGTPFKEFLQLAPPDPANPKSTDGEYIKDQVARNVFVAGILGIQVDTVSRLYIVRRAAIKVGLRNNYRPHVEVR